MGIFKAYDIRGIVPSELDADTARKIGHAFARRIEAKRLLVGQDMRTHSPEIAGAVIDGMLDAGADVVSIGLASTPMTYFAIGSQDVDGGLCVTASHNGGEYNGMKLCGRGATPISKVNGIGDIESMCQDAYPGAVAARGALEEVDLLPAYAEHVASFVDMESDVHLCIDAANGMAGHTLPHILPKLPRLETDTLFMEPDGTFPNHEANPIKEENLDDVRRLVMAKGAALGVGFDGDADRCCFVDETGRTVPADLMTALLAREFLSREPGAPIVYDLRSSWVVKEEIQRRGGKALRDRVGHSFIKATMREHGAAFAGELSGHFYFRDNFVCDSGVLAMVSALNLVARAENRGRKLSELVEDLRRYHATGEINFEVEDKAAAIAALRERYSDGRQDELDGITVEYGDLESDDWWWFNVRMSNTEPLLRLNLEARRPETRDARRDELIGLLGT
ncbi:MAG: phosphomannomutase/phosphoglucomutase, partial [Planctomycetota bacterium]|nr:phosphomannomutase/phosphoglucomutase [Planctomycetota bacterium]